jgi:SagB-type dehydrogenase family enzyme
MENENKEFGPSGAVPRASFGMTRRDFMKVTAVAAAGVGVLGSPDFVLAAEPTTVSLPAPKTDGKVSIEAALKQRRSVRYFESTPLTLEEVGQLCWAAQGVTMLGGLRTTPSPRAIYPLELYVAAGTVTGLSPGFYHYQPASHSLQLVAPDDKRADIDQKAVRQSWNPISKAPAVFVISGNVAKLASSGDPLVTGRSAQFMWVEAGLAAQGFFLEATAMGLGSVYTGAFLPKETHAVLGLPSSEEVLGILPVGRRM